VKVKASESWNLEFSFVLGEYQFDTHFVPVSFLRRTTIDSRVKGQPYGVSESAYCSSGWAEESMNEKVKVGAGFLSSR
jgi:hypothetical protein